MPTTARVTLNASAQSGAFAAFADGEAQSLVPSGGNLMHIARFTRPLVHSLVAAAMFSTSAGPALAQSHDHSGVVFTQPQKPTPQENELVQAVRDATETLIVFFHSSVGRNAVLVPADVLH
jgi:hypothetical protein